jgi:hypothetical protein
MFVQLPYLSAARFLIALAVALSLGDGFGPAKPASADDSQWTRSQSNWGNSTGWNRHWRSQTHHEFNSGTRIIIGGGSGVIVTRPGFVIGNPGFVNPGFIVNRPPFIVNQPGFIVGQPTFVRRPNLIFERPQFARKQIQFFRRHPSLRVGQPWWRNNWNHRHWKHKRWKHQMGGGMNWGGMH